MKGWTSLKSIPSSTLLKKGWSRELVIWTNWGHNRSDYQLVFITKYFIPILHCGVGNNVYSFVGNHYTIQMVISLVLLGYSIIVPVFCLPFFWIGFIIWSLAFNNYPNDLLPCVSLLFWSVTMSSGQLKGARQSHSLTPS